MSIEILTPIKYGRDGVIYKLKVGEFREKDFFEEDVFEKLLARNNVRFSKEDLSPTPEGEKIDILVDIRKFTVAEGKEFIDKEVSLTNLEKYLDMEADQETPRATLQKFIEGRIKELTGYDTTK